MIADVLRALPLLADVDDALARRIAALDENDSQAQDLWRARAACAWAVELIAGHAARAHGLARAQAHARVIE